MRGAEGASREGAKMNKAQIIQNIATKQASVTMVAKVTMITLPQNGPNR